MKDIAKIRERALSARDDSYYDKMYALTRWFAGDDTLMLGTEAMSFGGVGGHGTQDLPDYPYIDLPLGLPGVHNHGLVNSRINIQSVVYSDAEIVYSVQNPIIRETNAAFIKKRWDQGDWGSVFLECGMEVEATGLGIVEIGIKEGRLQVEHRSILDCLWDRGHRSRGQWRFIFMRNRLDVDECLEKYEGLITEEEAENLAQETRLSSTIASLVSMQTGALTQIREWSYWDGECHCIFLGSIADENSIIFRLKQEGEGFVYERVEDGEAGINPYGFIPTAMWVDCWTPGVLRPVSKTETTWRVARILNQLEAHVVNTVERDIPITIMSTANMSQDQIARIAKAKGPNDIGMIIPLDMVDVTNAIHRVSPHGIATGVLQAIQYYKELINATTGVADAQRGQPLPGDKTAEEVRSLSSAQGVQNKHLRRQYSSFLKEIINKGRLIAAKFDTDPMIIEIGDNMIDTGQVDITPFLEMPLDVQIRENSLAYESEKDKTMARLQEFQAVDMIAMDKGVADPQKVFKDVYEDIGVTDPMTRMFTPEQIQQRQMQEMQMQMLAQQSGQPPQGEPNA